jgi:hypothetical protein
MNGESSVSCRGYLCDKTGEAERGRLRITRASAILPGVKRPSLAIFALVITCLTGLSCGGGSMLSLSLQPAAASISTNYEQGTYSDVVLTATLSNGTVPTDVQWKTSVGCVAIDPTRTQNTNTVVCNFTCGPGTAKATITATAQGLTGTSSVTCTWQ